MTTDRIEDYTIDANTIKEMVLELLNENKVISSEVAAEYNEKWQIILVKKNWFKRWLRKFDKEEEGEDYMYKFVKFED